MLMTKTTLSDEEEKTMATHTVKNLPKGTPELPQMPQAPGSAKAAEPAPAHVIGTPKPAWLDSAKGRERHRELLA